MGALRSFWPAQLLAVVGLLLLGLVLFAGPSNTSNLLAESLGFSFGHVVPIIMALAAAIMVRSLFQALLCCAAIGALYSMLFGHHVQKGLLALGIGLVIALFISTFGWARERRRLAAALPAAILPRRGSSEDAQPNASPVVARRQGWWRLWVILTLMWVGYIGVVTFTQPNVSGYYQVANEVELRLALRQQGCVAATVDVDERLSSADGGRNFGWRCVTWSNLLGGLIVAVLMPAFALLFGAAVRWVWRGFHARAPGI